MPAPAHVQEKTLNIFMEAWARWSAKDMLAVFSDDFMQSSLPFSLGVPARTRPEVEAVLPKLMQTVTNFKLTICQVVHDPLRNMAAMYAISTADTPFGDWTNEYATFVTFDDGGGRITRVDEMMDSAFLRDFYPKYARYSEENSGL